MYYAEQVLFFVIFGVLIMNGILRSLQKSNLERRTAQHDARMSERDVLVKEGRLEIDRIRYGVKNPPVSTPVAAPAPVPAAAVRAAVTPAVATAVATPAVLVPSQEEAIPVGEAMALHATGGMVIALSEECSVVVDLYPEFDQAMRQITFTGNLAKRLGMTYYSLDKLYSVNSMSPLDLEVESTALAVEHLNALLSGEIGRSAPVQEFDDLRGRQAA